MHRVLPRASAVFDVPLALLYRSPHCLQPPPQRWPLGCPLDMLLASAASLRTFVLGGLSQAFPCSVGSHCGPLTQQLSILPPSVILLHCALNELICHTVYSFISLFCGSEN